MRIIVATNLLRDTFWLDEPEDPIVRSVEIRHYGKVAVQFDGDRICEYSNLPYQYVVITDNADQEAAE